MRSKGFTNFVMALMMLFLILGIGKIAAGQNLAQDGSNYWPTTSWSSSTPDEQGMNATKLVELMDYLDNESALHPTGVLVVRNGYIVLEEYLSTTLGENRTLDILSCTSSIISALVGIALDQDILGIDDPILEFFPDLEIDNYDARKESITIEHLLTNTAGLSWEENTDPISMRVQDDWVQYVLDKTMIHEPGTFFEYNSGLAHILSAILENVTGMTTLEFAETMLFEPLGITEYDWGADPQGIYDGGGGLELSLRDIAKFGYLYLNNGSWDGAQIVPQSWIIQSSSSHINVNTIKDYGYLWWIYRGAGIYNAVGFTARAVSIIPEYNIVAIVTGYDSTGDFLRNQWLHALREYIIPAAIEGPSIPNPIDLTPLILGGAIASVVIVLVAIQMRKRK
ncbi:MAG: serine hydrolase domain-containing protein [Candidatus Thorarchaeota archaeon]